jgi:hypothetical protein
MLGSWPKIGKPYHRLLGVDANLCAVNGSYPFVFPPKSLRIRRAHQIRTKTLRERRLLVKGYVQEKKSYPQLMHNPTVLFLNSPAFCALVPTI